MCVPSGLALYLEPLLGLITAKKVLDGTGHNVVNTRYAVGRRRSFIKYKSGLSFPGAYRFLKDLFLLPESIYILIDLRQVKLLIFREFLTHPGLLLQRLLKCAQR